MLAERPDAPRGSGESADRVRSGCGPAAPGWFGVGQSGSEAIGGSGGLRLRRPALPAGTARWSLHGRDADAKTKHPGCFGAAGVLSRRTHEI